MALDSFDPESGQVYRETVVPCQSKAPKAWEHKCLGKKPYNVLSGRDADSLTAMALRKLVCHADQLRPDTLASLPTHTVHQIRTAIRREGCETLNIWKIFAESGHGDKTFGFATSTSILNKPLVNYFLDLVSPSFCWMVDLDLVDVYCSRIDLRQLSSCVNLMSLRVRYTKANGSEPFDDEVCRNIAYRAVNDNLLNKLRMIFVANTQGITAKSFNHISQLPALDTFCVTGTSIHSRDIVQWSENGWNLSQNTPFSSHVKGQSLRVNYSHMRPRLSFSDLVQGYIQQRRSSLSTGDWNLPFVDVSFGPGSDVTFGSHDKSSVIKCFERERGVDSNEQKSLISDIAANPERSQRAKEPPLKKRKLKPTRAVGIDKMLEGL